VPVAAYPVTGPLDVIEDGRTGVLDEDLTGACEKALALEPGPCVEAARWYTWGRCAAQVLGYFGTADSKPALARVVEHDSNAMVRLYAADSLGMLGGREHDDLLRRLEPNENNRDTKRHIGYALDREGQSLDAEVVAGVRQWNIDGLGSASLGQPAPDFELTSLDGQRIRLSQFRGKQAVVIVFVYGDT